MPNMASITGAEFNEKHRSPEQMEKQRESDEKLIEEMEKSIIDLKADAEKINSNLEGEKLSDAFEVLYRKHVLDHEFWMMRRPVNPKCDATLKKLNEAFYEASSKRKADVSFVCFLLISAGYG